MKKPLLGLLPCPFCGATEPTVRLRGREIFIVFCDSSHQLGGCEATTHYSRDRDTAIAAWNRRSEPSTPRTPLVW